MKKNLRLLVGAAVGAVVSMAFTSCYYDPNYSSASVGGTYSSGYGDGYGYGGSGFSTSVFVGTGNPQWGYDPHCYSYYDYRRHAYYDPYLNGYYPVGYRPPIVYGVPHPYGWHPGVTYIRPPAYVSNVTVVNYNNRATLYQNTKYGWARQVRQQPASQGRVTGSHQTQGSYNGNGGAYRPNTGTRPASSSYTRSSQTTTSSSSQYKRESTRPTGHEQSGTLPSRYNTPVKSSDQQARQGQRNGGGHQQGQRQGNSQQNPKKGKNNPQAQSEDDNGRTTGRHN
ncbi:MAG: hypothetical protein ABIS50_17865 [Luteolibacter sp.]|uniref:hypothetical protein n=1 Tax=Luteolibacter sp. TaxID=1962973 RepID=UPI0032645DE8